MRHKRFPGKLSSEAGVRMVRPGLLTSLLVALPLAQPFSVHQVQPRAASLDTEYCPPRW